MADAESKKPKKEADSKEGLSGKLSNLKIGEVKEENNEQVSSDQLKELFELTQAVFQKLHPNAEKSEKSTGNIADAIQLLKDALNNTQTKEEIQKKAEEDDKLGHCQGVSPKTLYEEANGNMRILYFQLGDGYTNENRTALRAATHQPLVKKGWESEHKATSYLYYKHMRGEESDESLREGVQQVLNKLLKGSLEEETYLSSLLIKAISNGDFSFYISKPALIHTTFLTQPTMGYRKDKITCTLHILPDIENTDLALLAEKLTERGWISRANLKTVYSKERPANVTNKSIKREVGTIIEDNEIAVGFILMKPKYEVIEGKKTLVTFEQI